MMRMMAENRFECSSKQHGPQFKKSGQPFRRFNGATPINDAHCKLVVNTDYWSLGESSNARTSITSAKAL